MVTEEEIKKKIDSASIINNQLKLFSSGAKSVSSISRKFNDMPPQAMIGDIKDLVRATILVDDYMHVPHLMTELKQVFESFTGDVARSGSGYCGLHGNVEFEGFRAELQISTPEVLRAKILDDERYHRFMTVKALLRTKGLPTLEALKLSNERYELKQQEVDARPVFKKYYTDANLFDYLDDIKILFALYSANYKSNFKYDSLLSSTQKDENIYLKVNEKATRVQDDYENVIKNNFKEYIPQEIILPAELNSAKIYINKFENKSIELFENNFLDAEETIQDRIRDLAKLENKELINFIKYLQNNNYNVLNKRLDIEETNILNLVQKIKMEKEK